ncbi:MAG: hypothetical protein A2W34_07215 [Chloroflexi bacterium RBG_16_64_32]|nr:MAG: hypothetical protein A2W34_07215 [Chloroflexi bacterium RBG_16_64_32]
MSTRPLIQARSLVTAMAVAVMALLLLSPGEPLGASGDYTVAEGDTLSEIAATFDVSVELLAEVNGIEDPDFILVGQVIRIPGADESLSVADPGEDPGAIQTQEVDTYTVRSGDTLSEIADHFGVPVSAIVDANGLADPNFIVEGQTLKIPVVVSAPARPASPDVEPLLEQVAMEEGLDPGLVKALAYQESGWQQDVVSSTGAVGIMQIQPSTGYWLETDVFGYDLDIEMSAYDNIKAGVRYLRILLDLTGSVDDASAAYYQGYGALSLGILYEDTVRYVASVNAIKASFWP